MSKTSLDWLVRLLLWPVVPAIVGLVLRWSGYFVLTRVMLYVVVAWGVLHVGMRFAWGCRPSRVLLSDLAMTAAVWVLAVSPWWNDEFQRRWTQWQLYSSPLVVDVIEPQLTFTTAARSYDAAFLSIHSDGAGRLFVGGRERLYVIEPDNLGGFQPAQELFRFPPDSWLNDVESRGDDLYVMTNAALYLLPGARTKRENIECRRLIWGIPLDMHVSFHALAWGPQGDLYFSAGDPYLLAGAQRDAPDHWGLWTLFGPDDAPALTHVGAGGVFRCRPDGTQLRRVAGGLRGPFGLAFDPAWNLFVCDNDHESRPDRFTPARLLEVVPGMDYGWPRGWTPANTPRRSDVWPTASASLGAGVPVGMVYHEGFREQSPIDSLLLSRWESGIDRLSRDPAASGELIATRWLQARDSARPLGLAVESDGGVYVVFCKMISNATSPHYPAEIRRYAMVPRPQSWRDLASMSDEELYRELSSARMVRRSAAHQELLRRGPAALRTAAARWHAAEADDPARRHLPWLVAASVEAESTETPTRSFLDGGDGVLQALRIAAEYPRYPFDPELLRRAADSEDERKQLAALTAASARDAWSTADYLAVVRRSTSSRVLQLAGRLLAVQAELGELTTATEDESPRVRLAGVLAAGGRLTTPTTDEARRLAKPFLNEYCEHRIEYVGETRDLTKLGPTGTFTTADLWTSAASTEKGRLGELLTARLADPDDAVRFQAAHYLELLQDPRTLPAVHRVRLEADAALLADRPFEPIRRIVLEADRDTAREYRAKFRIISPVGQSALISIDPPHRADAFVNDEAASPYESQLLTYLEPGTNDVTLTLKDVAEPAKVRFGLRSSRSVVEADLPTVAASAILGDRAVDPALVEWLGDVSDEQLSRLVTTASVEEGRRLFGRDGVGCVRCHEVTAGSRGRGGPSLRNALERLKLRHLAESIILPSKVVDSQFRRTTLVLDDGRIIRGLILVNDVNLEMLTDDGRRLSIPNSSIEEQTPEAVSPMPTGLARTKQEVLNLLAYLAAKPPPPP